MPIFVVICSYTRGLGGDIKTAELFYGSFMVLV